MLCWVGLLGPSGMSAQKGGAMGFLWLMAGWCSPKKDHFMWSN
jgi:hypothetical protein